MFQNQWRHLGLAFIVVVASLLLMLIATAFRLNASTIPTVIKLAQVTNSIVIAQATNQKENEAVNSIARATTVFIGQNIENRKDLEVKGANFSDAGSGVIIARRNSTYYILTNQHVVPIRGNYGIRTHDGAVHQVQNSLPPYYKTAATPQPDTTKDLVYRFGVLDSNKKVINNYDLALLQFESSTNEYPVAVMGDSSTIKAGERVYVSGWPLPENTSKDRIRVFKSGELKQILNPNDPNGNYSLCYTAETTVGMSGGPVFNAKGEVIGIHGAGKNSRQTCIDTSLGIRINDFINEQEKIERYKLASAFKRPPANSLEFARMVKNRNADILTAAEYQKFFDVSPDDPAFNAILSMVDRYGCMRAFDDGSFQPLRAESRGELAIDINSCLAAMEQGLNKKVKNTIPKDDFASIKKSIEALAQEIGSLRNNSSLSPKQEENSPNSQVSFASPKFTFLNINEYSNCLEDIIQLYQNPDNLRQQRRKSNCLAEIFQAYGDTKLSKSQALELIQAANTYATSPTLTQPLYPLKGQRIRIREMFEFVYDIDRKI